MTSTPPPTETTPAPRRPARAWTPWPRGLTHRYTLRALILVIVAALAVPAWSAIEHAVRSAEAYAEGRANARRAIAGGYLVLDSFGDPNGEIFVDPTTGVATTEPMMCCVISPYDEARDRGFADEVARAWGAGELAPLDLRPKLRTEAEVLALFDERSDDVFDLLPDGGERAAGAFRLVWSEQTEDSPWSHLRVTRGELAIDVMGTSVQAPARALLVDDGTTLLLIESTTAVQILDLTARHRLAYYGGWMSANPRR